ncbi:male sterility protein [Stachybotrys elegans]|uniref:gluconokinase n=1 Tax=Stachybotrys elegans TaxID=80388 RepID=A0A8K0SKW6_9HYPO|nr:male sterility protein [Stachybotrys elegans]
MPATVYVPSHLETHTIEPGAHSLVQLEKPAPVDDSSLPTIDALLRRRALLYPEDHAVSYPSSEISFRDYTMKQLDVYAWRVAKDYEHHLPVRQNSTEKPSVVALLGPSNLEYLITMLALTKLGHSVLLLSTRIPQVAIESLISTTGASALLADSRFLDTAEQVGSSIPQLQVLQIAGRDVFEFHIETHSDTQLGKCLDPETETNNVAFIIHSSGSTGLPKPIYQTHKSCLSNYAMTMNMKAFITLPLFHNHGICNFFRAIYSRKSIHLYNADLPLTQEHLINIMRETQFEIFYGVPYALKLLSETAEGIDLLRQLKVVMYGGSACPDDLGNTLVASGVNLVGHYGATEVGQLMTSFRPEGDKVWNYVREHEKLSPFLKWIPHGPLYECCVLDGWPAKVHSNQPDGSYATKDLFEPHPTIPRAWKYIARLDDTIVLVNGEKFNPVATEGSIRSNKNVTEAVIFGAGRPYLGILVVPAASDCTTEEKLDAIWSIVNAANASVDAFARISKSMICLLPSDCAYPRTDKGSIIRQAFYKTFQNEIEEAYDRQERSGDALPLNEAEIGQFLRQLLSRTLSLKQEVTDTTDFFQLGLDSLQAIQMRSEILKGVDIGGNRLGQNVIFDHPSIDKLCRHLLELRLGHVSESTAVESEMMELIDKYSSTPIGSSIVVTGATGSLGAHVVAKLCADPSINKIYCLVRASTEQALQRVNESLLKRRVYHTLSLDARRKIVALPSNLADPNLGLGEDYHAVSQHLRAVIHCAWSVNFNMQLPSFEDNIAGVKHLILLCQSSPLGATMNFCSSVSTCSRATVVPIPESAAPLEWAQGMGYAQSKSVAEHICAKARVTARVLRVGQIVGDTKHGIWNAQEAVPMMMQTAVTMGALPRLNDSVSWLPVDTVAQAVIDISLSEAGSVFANVTNPRMFSWTQHLLPALHEAGLTFEEVEPKEWITRLRASNPDPTQNPTIKLVDFFASKYDKEVTPSKTFMTETACSLSPALSNAPGLDKDLVKRFVTYFLNQWKPNSAKTAIVIAGPCGTGKSTVGSAMSSELCVPFIEGDSLHTKAAVEKMRSQIALCDNDRMHWFDRLCHHAEEALLELDYDSVVVSCSALKRMYRSHMRQALALRGIRTVFVNLQTTPEILEQRLEQRHGHYMTAQMVIGQSETYEQPSDEIDVFPIDTTYERDSVIAEVKWLLRQVLTDHGVYNKLTDDKSKLIV